MSIVELLKRSNHYTNHRAYTERVIKEYVEIAQPLRLKYPNLVFKDLINTQFTRNGGRGTEPFDSQENMMRIEREVLGIVGSKFSSTTRNQASRATFANSIIANPKNFTIYNNKIKAEKQQIIDMELLEEQLEEQRLAEILKEKVKQDEIKRVETVKLKLVTIPEITPVAVATSSLLPLGIIALLLYSRTGRK
tara:strand:- start:430 stop:1008 length:579 start_codon:yes stop_codon:yes gene_type:complete